MKWLDAFPRPYIVVRVVDVCGWAAVALVLSVYALAPRWFDVANAVLCVPVAMPALLRRAYPSASISLAFGVIGALHLVRAA